MAKLSSAEIALLGQVLASYKSQNPQMSETCEKINLKLVDLHSETKMAEAKDDNGLEGGPWYESFKRKGLE